MNNGPELWKAILTRFPEGSVIAGGAVRDYFLGTVPKDIDVFVPYQRGSMDWLDTEYFCLVEDETAEEYEGMNPIVDGVFRGKLYGFTVDVVHTTLPLQGDPFGLRIVNSFDFAINWSWFDTELHDTFEAMKDRKHKLVTLKMFDRMDRAETRFARLKERYPELQKAPGFEDPLDKELAFGQEEF